MIQVKIVQRPKKGQALHPLYIRTTVSRKEVYYKLIKKAGRMSASDFAGLSTRRGEMLALYRNLMALEAKAHRIANDLTEFNYAQYLALLEGKAKPDNANVYERLSERHSELLALGRTGTANTYASALSSLKSYHPDKLQPSQVTVKWLEAYEYYMRRQGKSTNTIGIYLRVLRTELNKFKLTDYPFGRGKYTIPTADTVKKALKAEELSRLFAYRYESPAHQRWLDLWKIIYFANGLNVKDLILLKWSDWQGDRITYVREKTKLTRKRNKKPILIHVFPQLEELLKLHALEGNRPAGLLLFEHQHTGDKAIKQYAHFVTRQINNAVGQAANAVGIPQRVTTYSARHSFVTRLLRERVPIVAVQELLGHGSLQTTQIYASSIVEDFQSDIAQALSEGL